MRIKQVAKDGALGALSPSKPGNKAKERDYCRCRVNPAPLLAIEREELIDLLGNRAVELYRYAHQQTHQGAGTRGVPSCRA